MKRTQMIEAAYKYLVDRARKKKRFSVTSFVKASGWADSTAKGYLKKVLHELVSERNGWLIAKPEVLQVSIERFSSLFPQKKSLFAKHDALPPCGVLVYEFFMPLSREPQLREALDNLFYQDAVDQRISEIGYKHIRSRFTLSRQFSNDRIHGMISGWINQAIGGYSISTVGGRFRAGDLVRRDQSYKGYIVDETTAIVRFILPIPPSDSGDKWQWLFRTFFAEAVARAVPEDEIWMLETSGNVALARWTKKKS